MPSRADTKAGGRFCMKRCGPSCRRVRNASAIFKIFLLTRKRLFQHYRHETDMPTALRDVRSQGQSGKHILGLSFSVVVEGFGCRPATAARHTPVAGVRKPPRKEPAGDGAQRMPRTPLWGFG